MNKGWRRDPVVTDWVKLPKWVMINQNHPSNELINVIQKKYNECEVGFLVDASDHVTFIVLLTLSLSVVWISICCSCCPNKIVCNSVRLCLCLLWFLSFSSLPFGGNLNFFVCWVWIKFDGLWIKWNYWLWEKFNNSQKKLLFNSQKKLLFNDFAAI